MGAWGGGLYGSDFALDLKGTIKGMLRAPLSDDEALAEIWTAHGKGASDIEALDYWLVLADQLERQGLLRRDVFERARAIIDGGEDVAALQALGASSARIAARRRETGELLARLRRPRPASQRKPLKKPQPLLLEKSEALTWPTDKGCSINPYVREELLWKLGGFTQDGWGFGVVAEAGHQFHVLAYYAIRVLQWRRPARPAAELAVHCRSSDNYYGTLSRLHLQRAKVERLGRAPPAALAPTAESAWDRRQARDAVLRNLSVTGNFGMDAWNTWWSHAKFPHDPPSGRPLDPGEPDQRPPPPSVRD
ncbi:MAG: hypothetical protein K0S54_1159 [Alphaproteobacteria bacterium]|nr:hypothetical protein [Alphaproteobacteria bacterium]